MMSPTHTSMSYENMCIDHKNLINSIGSVIIQ